MSSLRNRQKKIVKKTSKNKQKHIIRLNNVEREKIRNLEKATNMSKADIIEIAIRRLYECDNNILHARNHNRKD